MTPEQLPEEWRQKNRRRIELIKQKHHQGLTVEQAAELCRLETEVFAYLDKICPRPTLDQEYLECLEARLRSPTRTR